MTVRTTVVYPNNKLEKGMLKMVEKGWVVEKMTPIEQGYGCLKTGCLGLLFLPLALLGKKQGKTAVVFYR